MRIPAFLFAAVLLAGGLAPAQAEDRPLLTLDMAKRMADACEAHRERAGDWRPIIIAIVDRGADLVLLRRQDDAFLGSIDIATGKAVTAARLPFPTRTLAGIIYGEGGNPGRAPGLVATPGVMPLPGGLPVRNQAGQMVGAIGVSGATGDQDEECAQAGIDAVARMLR